MSDTVTKIGLRKKYTLDRFSDMLKPRKSKFRRSSLPKGEPGLRSLLVRYKANARNRGIAFKLTKDQFKEITSQNCHYCGVEPVQQSFTWNKGMSKEGAEHSLYVYNGVDRVDVSKPYVMGNVLPCCGFCNRSKNKYTYEQFTSWIERCYHNLNKRKAG